MKKKVLVAIVAMLATVLLVVICSLVISKPWRYVSIKHSTDVSKETFLQQMEKLDEYYNTTNFSKIAEQVFDEAQIRGYNVYLAPSVMCIETDGGTAVKAQFNYWTQSPISETTYEFLGFVAYRYFESQEESVKWFFDELDNSYEKDVTYEEFARKWIPHPSFLPDPSSRTEESDAYGEKLYKMLKWIQSL